MAVELPLAGLRVLVTRSQPQQPLLDMLQQAGAVPIALPTIVIKPLPQHPTLQQAIAELPQTDMMIFTSINAVNCAAPLLKSACVTWPPLPQTLAVGPSTRYCLLQYGWHEVSLPSQHYTSEGLLALPLLQQLHTKHITIFTGVGGRDFLSPALTSRGAKVTQAICYERIRPEYLDLSILDETGKVDIIITSSSEGLANLIALANPQQKQILQQIPIMVVSQRMVMQYHQANMPLQFIVAPNADNHSIMATLVHWYKEYGYGRKSSN